MSETISGVPAILANEPDNLLAMAQAAEMRVEAIKRIKLAALRSTNKNDWVDQGGKPYLWVSGAEKVARLFGISWRISEPVILVEDDGHFSFTYKGSFSMGTAEIEAIGARSSKDDFFAKRKGEYLPASEIDKNNIKKAAFTNCIGNGVTRLLGIRNLTWEDLADAGIRKEDIGKVEYGKAEMSEEVKDQKEEARKMLLEMAGGSNDQARVLLEMHTKFTGRDGKEVPGKKSLDQLSESAMKVTYGKVKKAYEAWKKEAGASDGANSGEPA